jgi:signal transduction histidine kinase
VRVLRSYGILDTPAEAAYDALARLAASVTGAPLALIAFVDETRTWFKASIGLDGLSESPRGSSFCAAAIEGRDVFEVADARADHRFTANPLVAGGLGVRFYAGAPLLTPAGEALGAVGVLDREARTLGDAQRAQLALIARLVTYELERGRLLSQLAAGLGSVSDLTQTVLASARPSTAVRALVEAVGAATGGKPRLLRRAIDGTYAVVAALDDRPLPGGRAPLGGPAFALADTPFDELVMAIPDAGPHPEFALAIRYAGRRAEADRGALELVASAFAIAVRNIALHAESERRRVELLEARATQAELVARLARDVRGPVTSIIGFARLLEEDGRFSSDAREALAMVRANGERVAEIASDIDLLSRIELAAVDPQWVAVDLRELVTAAGAVVERAGAVRVVADPELLTTALGRLVHDGRRALAPVRARLENLDEAVVIELNGTGASPADPAAPTIGSRLTQRIVERHGGSFRTGSGDGAWWVRLILPADPRRVVRRLRVLFVGTSERGAEIPEQLRALGFVVEVATGSSVVRAALPGTDVVVVPGALAAWAGIDRIPPAQRRQAGWVLLSGSREPAGEGWDAVVSGSPQPAEVRGAVYAAASKARLRRSDDAPAASAN